MDSYKERVLKEREDLHGKIQRLSAFILSPKFGTDLSTEAQNQLHRQVRAMSTYLEVLDERICDF
jgi:hypothetical protein